MKGDGTATSGAALRCGGIGALTARGRPHSTAPDHDTGRQRAELLRQMGPAEVAMTRGSRGSTVYKLGFYA